MIFTFTIRFAGWAASSTGAAIIYLLLLFCIASSFIIGDGIKKKPDATIASGFEIMIGITVFSILDLDRPYRGLITLDRAEQLIVDLRGMFNKD